MNDIETAALIVGGHTFGKTHGNGDAELVGPEPEAAPLELQGLGWNNPQGTGVGIDAVSSGLEVIWTHTPIKWDNSFLEILYGNEWELFKSPAGANQWRPKDGGWANSVPEAFGTGKTHPSMLTTDLAMRIDPIYEKITRRWLDHPEELATGVRQRLVQAAAPRHGPGRALPRPAGSAGDAGCGRTWFPPGSARSAMPMWPRSRPPSLASDLTVPQLVSTAWKAAASFRGSDKRGGANGGRIRLQPQAGWELNEPDELAQVVRKLEEIQKSSGTERVVRRSGGPRWRGRRSRRPPRTPDSTSRCRSRRVAATPLRSRPTSSRSRYLEPHSDGFRNYLGKGGQLPAEFRLVDRANLLGLSGSGADGSGRWPARARARTTRTRSWVCSPTSRAR